jgi:transposase-like protein
MSEMLFWLGLGDLIELVLWAICALVTPRCPKCRSRGERVRVISEHGRWRCRACGFKYR